MLARVMLLAMTTFVQPWPADVVVSGIAGLLIGLIVYLLRLEFQERRERRKLEEHRQRQRLAIWGHE
jgi:hypothetical protein